MVDREYIESKRDTVMDADEFRKFITKVYCDADSNYSWAADILGSTAPTVRRVVHDGKDSKALRKAVGVRKSNRVRVSFECEPEFRDEINKECEYQDISRSKLIVNMFAALHRLAQLEAENIKFRKYLNFTIVESEYDEGSWNDAAWGYDDITIKEMYELLDDE